jgi:hypothetical protein
MLVCAGGRPDDARMADEEQLYILRQGVETWNAWRNQHPDVIPNLVTPDGSMVAAQSEG